MEDNVSQSFFCELKPTMMANNINPLLKEPCSFYFSGKGNDKYHVYGISSSGVLKQGEASYIEDDDGGYVRGSYIEKGVEISFSLGPINTFDSSYFFGSANWNDQASSGAVRQKYATKIWDGRLPIVAKDFLRELFENITKLKDGNADVYKALSATESKVSELETKISKAKSSVDNLSDFSDQANDVISLLNQSKDSFDVLNEDVKKSLDSIECIENRNKQFSKAHEELLSNAHDLINEATLAKEKADNALGSTITLGLANSFKQRKTEASKLRKLYDTGFIISIIVALVILSFLWGDVISPSKEVGDILQAFLYRMPFLAFPIWLGIYFSKRSSTSSRIEEFYAQKQALAESYEGYKNEISKISDSHDGSEELIELMRINLRSISKDSSDILDQASNENHSPLGELLNKARRENRQPSKEGGAQEQ